MAVYVTSVHMDALSGWLANGEAPTLEAMRRLLHTEPEVAGDILEGQREFAEWKAVQEAEKKEKSEVA